MRNFTNVIATRSLGPIDEKFGDQVNVRWKGRVLNLRGVSLGVVREIFGNECYIRSDELSAARNILDLGANAGVFSIFALASAPLASVHMVEAQTAFLPIIRENLFRNDLATHVTVENAIAGGVHDDWTKALATQDPPVPIFSIAEYLSHVQRCDFLKCDIEGAEFALLHNSNEWLKQVERIALEYHGTWKQGAELGQTLQRAGFTVRQAAHGRLGYLFGTR